MARGRLILACGILAVALGAQSAQPTRFNYQARLTDAGGAPLSGIHDFYFSLYEGGNANTAGSGTLLFRELGRRKAMDGVVNHTMGTGTTQSGDLTDELFRKSSDIFLEVGIDSVGNAVLPRTRLEPVPFALASNDGDARIPLSGPLPITISQPGSYYLTQSLSLATTDKHGITISASNVTLDLNGYTLTGPDSGTRGGIASSGVQTNIIVRNGTLTKWGSDGGVYLEEVNGGGVEAVVARENRGTGISSPTSATVSRCGASGNISYGITGGAGSVIESCTANGNSLTGIVVGGGGVVRRCSSRNNTGGGILVQPSGVISDCSAQNNGGSGITLQQAGVASACASEGNAGDGIHAGLGCVIADCAVRESGGEGIYAGQKCLIRSCTIANTGGAGIRVDDASRVEGCTVADFWAADGITCAGAGCHITGNSLDGYSVYSNSATYRSTGTGIAAGTAASVKGNRVADCTTGISASNGLVVSNETDNCGTALNATGVVGPTVNSGNIATATNPFANISY
jgi:hypothetical protein